MYRKFYLSLLLISGVVLFAFSILATVREINPEWMQHQEKYKKLFVEKAKEPEHVEKAKAFKSGHQQIYLSKLNKVDRCMNCHLGVENPLMANAEAPYKQHPGNYLEKHPVAKFGCTVCHEGQGRATNKREAHGTELETHWDAKLLPMKYLQSSCAKCHDLDMLKNNGGEKVAAGEALFKEKGCRGCHKLNGVGGVIGKALDGVGSQPVHYFSLRYVEGDKTTYQWLKEHFIDPRKIVPESEMKVSVTDEEADMLTAYVMTIKTEELPKHYRRIKEVQEASMNGEQLYKMYCVACHAAGTQSVYDEIFNRTIPAIMNPVFSRTVDDKFLGNVIRDGRTDTQMTAWRAEAAGLKDEEINEIVKYITKDRPQDKPASFGFAGFRADATRGKDLYELRCTICHGAEGKGGKDILGINLRNPVVQNADPEFLAITVRDGRSGTPMVPFGENGLKLQNQEIADIVAYVKTLSQKK